jgi:hypothetical protein
MAVFPDGDLFLPSPSLKMAVFADGDTFLPGLSTEMGVFGGRVKDLTDFSYICSL